MLPKSRGVLVLYLGANLRLRAVCFSSTWAPRLGRDGSQKSICLAAASPSSHPTARRRRSRRSRCGRRRPYRRRSRPSRSRRRGPAPASRRSRVPSSRTTIPARRRGPSFPPRGFPKKIHSLAAVSVVAGHLFRSLCVASGRTDESIGASPESLVSLRT